jgi:putative membrane protein
MVPDVTTRPQFLRVARMWAFMTGAVVVAAVLATPLANVDHHSLTGHMVQHLMLMTLAAPLILLGKPEIVWSRRPQYGLIHRLPVHHGQGQALSGDRRHDRHAIVGWCAGTACVICWHVPSIFQLSLQSGGWHEVEQVTFLVAGLLFWRPVIEGWSTTAQWSIPVYLFLATLPCDALAAFLAFCGRPVYSAYLHGPAGVSAALLDQEVAGSMMWVWVTFAYLMPAVLVTIQGLSHHEPSMRSSMSVAVANHRTTSPTSPTTGL